MTTELLEIRDDIDIEKVIDRAKRALDDAGGLMGSSEVASRLEVNLSNLSATKIPGLPEPYQVLLAGRFWIRAEIEAFAAAREARKAA